MTKTQIKILEAKNRSAQLSGVARSLLALKILCLEFFVAIHKIGSHFVLGKHRTFEKFAQRNEHGIITDSFTEHERFHRISVGSAAMAVFISFAYVLAGILAPAPTEIHAASLVVTDNGDTGDGVCDSSCTLRDALDTANTSPGPDAISFDAAMTITPTSPLPNITEGVSVNGDVDSNGTPDVVLNGGSAGAGNGITIISDDVTISGLVIQGFAGNGIAIQGSNNTVTGNYIGTNSAGTAASANTTDGVVISDDTVNPSSNNTIGGNTASSRNIISGNNAVGVRLIGSLVTSNTVAGNYIGTNAAGTSAIANGSGGVRIESSATGNMIGGNLSGANPGEAPGNVISGNSSNPGVALMAASNQVAGNIIGLVAAGTTALPNSDGITISAASNTIGGSSSSYRNIISGNGGHGISHSSGASTTVQNNYIGIDMAGTTARANSSRGINLVGGDEDILDNVISGNSTGVQSNGSSTLTIKGNKIGTNAAGTAAISGATYGVYALNGTFTIGGTSASDRNIISGNSGYGIVAVTSNPRVTVLGNYIGTDVNGTSAVPNGTGMIMAGGATGNVIGGTNATTTCSGSCNVISGNTTNEIKFDSNSHGNTLKGNFIGVNAAGTKPLVWTTSGTKVSVQVNDGSYNNQIGGARDESIAELGEGNLISGNQQSGGVALKISNNAFNGTTANQILGNLIGSSPAGAYQDLYNNTTGASGADSLNDFGNTVGVYCVDSRYCSVGDGTTNHANLVSGNGVGIQMSNSPDALVDLNYVGTNKTASGPFSGTAYQGRNGLHIGIYFIGGHDELGTVVQNNVVSGFYKASPDLSGGVASANVGVAIMLGNADWNLGGMAHVSFIKNKIGTNKAGTAVAKNNIGFFCSNASEFTIGSTDIADRNIISGNGESGVGGPFMTDTSANGYCADSTIQNNYFGTDATGNTSLGNGNSIYVRSADFALSWLDNVIASSTADGIYLNDLEGGQTISGNNIGVGADGTTNLANAESGIRVFASGALTLSNNLIANNGAHGFNLDSAAGDIDGNTITENTNDGMYVADSNNVTVTDNEITNNGDNGIEFIGVSNFEVGQLGHGNTISGHNLNGIALTALSHDNTLHYNTISSNGDAGTVNGAGVYIDASFNNTIAHNTLDQNVRGVAISSSTSHSEQNVIDTNDITNSLSSGILIQNGPTQGNTISNNTLSANHAYGIDNDTTHSTDDPTPVGGDNVIDSNTITLNLLSGIRNYGASPAITNNTFTQNVKSGVMNIVNYGSNTNPSTASDDTVSRPSLTNNTFNGNQEYGIYSLDTAPTNKSTLISDNNFDDNNTLGRIKQDWYGLVLVTVAGTAKDAAAVDVFDSSETDSLASLTTASNGYAPDTASLTDVQTWQVIPEFQVSPTGTLQSFGPHKIIAAADGDSETISFNFNGVNDSGESVPSGFGNISGRYQVALDNITKVPSTIHGTVFVDSNENGTQDSGESGKLGVPVTLYASSDTTYGGDTVSATTNTGSDGTFTFSNVVNGNYFVFMSLPTGFDQTTANPGDVITFAAENQTATRNFGLAAIPVVTVPSGTISGTVYQDSNANKTIDSGETGISGVTVRLYADSNGNGTYDAGTDQFLSTRTSNTSGVYRFIGIHLRDYFLRLDVPSNRSLTTANNPTSVLALDADGKTITENFGLSQATVTPEPEPEPEPNPNPKPKPGAGGGVISIINTLTGGSVPGIVAPRTGASTANSLVAVAVAGLAIVNFLLAAGSAFPTLLRLLLDLFTEPLMALFGSKKQPWGKVFDSITNLPIDLGIVRLYDANTMKLTATAVTDRTGRFKFFPKKGFYVAKADKLGYLFPSSLLKSAPTYQKPNYYFGEKFTIDDMHQTFNRDVPVDREDNKGSDALLLKLRTKQALHTVFAYSGVVISIVNMVILFSWLTFGFFVLHVLLFLFFWRITQPKKPKSWGIVYDEETKKPVAGAVVRIFDQRFGRLLDAAISNRNGKFGFLIGPSTYYLSVEAKGYIFPGTRKSSHKDYIGGTIEIKDANQVISYDIPLKKRPE